MTFCLQENVIHKLSKYMPLYTCHFYYQSFLERKKIGFLQKWPFIIDKNVDVQIKTNISCKGCLLLLTIVHTDLHLTSIAYSATHLLLLWSCVSKVKWQYLGCIFQGEFKFGDVFWSKYLQRNYNFKLHYLKSLN